jgi:hypothetical protein
MLVTDVILTAFAYKIFSSLEDKDLFMMKRCMFHQNFFNSLI